MIHLDTNYLIAAIRPGTQQAIQVNHWIATGEPIRVIAMVWAEFICGPVADGAIATALEITGAPLPVTAIDAEKAAELFNFAGRRRGSLADCLIAAAAIRMGATLATANRADFTPFVVVGLRVTT